MDQRGRCVAIGAGLGQQAWSEHVGLFKLPLPQRFGRSRQIEDDVAITDGIVQRSPVGQIADEELWGEGLQAASIRSGPNQARDAITAR